MRPVQQKLNWPVNFKTKGLGLTPQRIGILGGAFDPPHIAHVAMAEAAIVQFHLDELIVVPTGKAWHKPRDLSNGEHRAAMAKLAFSHLRQARVDEIELHREGASYTIDTLRSLSDQYPDAQFFYSSEKIRAKPWQHGMKLEKLPSEL